jgi:hypothetical protein
MKTLGVSIAPDGNMMDQYETMLQASRLWTEQMRTVNLSKTDAWISFISTVSRTLAYPLPATTLTK